MSLMNTKELRELIAQGESETVEFKKSISEIDSAFKTVCAFLNTRGGIVLIGVNNEGKVVGQPKTDQGQQKIASNIKKIQKSAQSEIEITYAILDYQPIICIQVNKGENLPYTYETRAYERVQNTTSLMSHERFCFFITRNHSNHGWETLLADNYSFNDLQVELIKNVIRKGVQEAKLPQEALIEDVPQILQKFGLIKNSKVNNAAVVLLGKIFLPNYPQCLLKLARFKGVDRSEFIDKLSLHDNLFNLLNEAMNFIRRNIPVAAEIEEGKLERKETPAVPFKALREAMLNALCHRDYSSRGGDTAIAIYDDRLEIMNSGGLLDGLTVEKIKKGEIASEQRRNPLIAHFLDKCGYIERWGRGIQQIIKICKEAGNPEPIFFSDEIGFKVTFKFSHQSVLQSQKHTALLMKEIFRGLKSIRNSMANEMPQSIAKLLTVRQWEILGILANETELTAKEILNKLEKIVSPRQLRRDLSALKKYGLINSEGRAQTAVWFLTSSLDHLFSLDTFLPGK